MGYPYHFVDLTQEEKTSRRELLDLYGVYAQLSALVPLLVVQLYRIGVWVLSARSTSKVDYSEVPSSPTLKRRRGSATGTLVQKWRKAIWWLNGEVAPGWGVRGRLLATGAWTIWLLFLCVHKTGDDYMHITKRFGEIAASQFPLHYMLSMKSVYSPLGLLKISHEELLPWHQLSGRVIYFLLLSHGAWYLNFFVQNGVLLQRLTARVVILGVVGLVFLTILVSSSLAVVRKWNYRLFFVTHLILGISLPPLLWFHAHHMRIYMVEASVLFIIDIISRKLDTVTGFATIASIPSTSLLKLKILVPPAKLARFKAAPGQHVYLSIPSESTPPKTSSVSIHDLLYNPFTVASVSETAITLVLRTLNGPTTKALGALTSLHKAKPPIKIEGPYGSSRHFPQLADYDRVLLVAGGVGASFILPIYREVRDQLDTEGRSPEHVKLVWSMRSSAEAVWAGDCGVLLEEDESAKVFFTRGALGAHPDEVAPEDGSVELSTLAAGQEPRINPSGGLDRPDLSKIVDEVFRYGVEERVAVLVCGPTKMARELRRHVGRWVERGREVFWHDESFGL